MSLYSALRRFIVYNLLFLFLQFTFIAFQGSSFLSAISLPITVYIELAVNLGIQLGLYLLLAVVQTLLFWAAQRYPICSPHSWLWLIWLISICALLSANAYFFPLSVFSHLLLPDLGHTLWGILLLGFALILGLLLVNLLLTLALHHQIIFILFVALMSVMIWQPHMMNKNIIQISTKPNIILIGIDSLSPSYIQEMPTVKTFIQHSVNFTETISPLARTYPAWVSILTGLYPHHHQARYNLMPPNLVKSQNSIAWTLQKLGYTTLFATDDRRFNSIDKDFGFQTIIGPKTGVNDVLLGTFNDFPLSNLLINLSFSRWLFPYNYLNRASHFSYYPQTFDRALKQALQSPKITKPLFLGVHFTLPHWPYAWAASSPAQVRDEYSVQDRQQLYLAALRRADEQIKGLLQVLQQQGYLKNSLIILLSDHGEAIYLPGSRGIRMETYQGQTPSALVSYFKRKTSTALEMSAGHGSDLLSPTQFHCLLAFQIYEHNHLVIKPGTVTTRVALIDIAPTLEHFLHLPASAADGISLYDALQGKPLQQSNRAFILESGMLPNQFLSREKAKKLAKQFFMVTPDGKLQLRRDELTTLDTMKLYGIIQGHWLLALYPDEGGYIPVLLRLDKGYWVDDLQNGFAQQAPAQSMLQTLQQFYNKPLSLVTKQLNKE